MQFIKSKILFFAVCFSFIAKAQVLNTPDIVILNSPTTTQSENSVFIDPNDPDIILNANNSSPWTGSQATGPVRISAFGSIDGGNNWSGTTQVSDQSFADPAAAVISTSGTFFVGSVLNCHFQFSIPDFLLLTPHSLFLLASLLLSLQVSFYTDQFGLS